VRLLSVFIMGLLEVNVTQVLGVVVCGGMLFLDMNLSFV
jgi:hypothetical protein